MMNFHCGQAPFGLSLLNKIKLKRNINVLDIGFGLGFPLVEVAMRLGDSSKVYGIDPWKAAIKRTQEKIQQCGISNIELIEGVAENIPLKDASVDLVISNNGINNVADLQQTLNECGRVAKSGAQFVLTVNLQETMIEFYEIYKQVLVVNNLEIYVEEVDKQIYHKRKPLNELKERLEQSGFSILSAKEDEFSYQFVDGKAMFNHFLISLAFLDSWKNVLPIDKQKHIFNEIEKKIDKLASENGVFSLSVPYVTVDCIKI
ncbi:MAG: methyltransferase domain-containing protein [Chloroflexia bacterium]|nr:methyltransferase domain-containing protein [Chloroflexia bacterium]